MFRAAAGVIIGFVCLTVLVVLGFAAAYLALGPEGTFREDTWNVTGTWIALTSIVGLLAAIAAGAVCALIARPPSSASAVLIALIVVLGLVEAYSKHAILYRNDDRPPPERDESLSMQEAADHAREPLYVSLLNPVIGAVGVFLGARLIGPRHAQSPAEPNGER